ncbi:ankyrin repeat and zinc finger domain-containing protein 1 [Ornithorhynchus anatinus]|uniref:ankyrin repeat and zinc finger domain-containing protein 1 n=1 Tax=Ornithorhynchus anatinus TaxID=9258 RepID=UPI0019D416DB|nr:ankyrin repeat and zinc finger domain-containing protein 1 [Ornithorhynchus anatinus]
MVSISAQSRRLTNTDVVIVDGFESTFCRISDLSRFSPSSPRAPRPCPGSGDGADGAGHPAGTAAPHPRGPAVSSERTFCSACAQTFRDRRDQREHYKLDWHRFNLKQRLRGRAPLPAAAFQEKTQAGDVSGTSGSEDSTSTAEESGTEESDGGEGPGPGGRPRGTRPHRVLFRNARGRFLSAFRCLLGPRREGEGGGDHPVARLEQGGPKVCAVLMAAAGHFAGAVFRSGQVETHKTLHRYAARARRGTAQGSRDARGAAPRSAGASLRRYNEAALCEEARELLAGPGRAGAPEEADTVPPRTPRRGRGPFFGERGAPLRRRDPRLWDIPIAARRPTFREGLRVLRTLAALDVHDEDPRRPAPAAGPRRSRKARGPREGEAAGGKTPEAALPEAAETPERTAPAGPPSPVSPCPRSECGGEESRPPEALELVEVTLGTLELREFEVALPRRRRRRPKPRARAVDADRAPGEGDGPPGSPGEGDGAPGSPGEADGPPSAPPPPGEGAVGRGAERAGGPGGAGGARGGGPDGPSAPPGDARGRAPYAVAADKSTRNVSRRFSGERPDAFDRARAQVSRPAPWPPPAEYPLSIGGGGGGRARGLPPRDLAAPSSPHRPLPPPPTARQVPGPPSAETEARQAARRRREREERDRREEEERRAFAALSDREKVRRPRRARAAGRSRGDARPTRGSGSRRRAVAAEKRLAAAARPGPAPADAGRRRGCGLSPPGPAPFRRHDSPSCSTRCLQEHRRGSGRAAPRPAGPRPGAEGTEAPPGGDGGLRPPF